MLSKLRGASQAGNQFRNDVAQSSGFGLTKWFDGIASSVKAGVLAIAVAAGASGCATVSQEAQLQQGPAATYGNWVAQTQELDALPADDTLDIRRADALVAIQEAGLANSQRLDM